jgi:hypothetical protein
LNRDLDRCRRLRVDIDAIDVKVMALLAGTDGQILTTLPGVPRPALRPSPHMACRSSISPMLNICTRQRVWRQRCTSRPHWNVVAGSRDRGWRNARRVDGDRLGAGSELTVGCRTRRAAAAPRDGPSQARVACGRHGCRLAYRLLRSQRPFDEQRQLQRPTVTAIQLCRTAAQPGLPPARPGPPSRRTRKPAAHCD